MSIGELACPNLDYVYEMTWAEFRIRLNAYNRIQMKEWYKIREVAWASIIAPHVNPKELPKTKELFMPIGDKKDISDKIFDKIRKAQQQYQIDKK